MVIDPRKSITVLLGSSAIRRRLVVAHGNLLFLHPSHPFTHNNRMYKLRLITASQKPEPSALREYLCDWTIENVACEYSEILPALPD